MASRTFAVDVDFARNYAKQFCLENLDADPAIANSREGQLYFNTVSLTVRQFDGTQWKNFAADLSFNIGLKEENKVVDLKPATAAEIGGVTVAPVATSNLTLDDTGALVSQAATNTQPGSIRIATDAETAETVAPADALETVAVNPKQLRTLHAHSGHKVTMEMDDKTFVITLKLLDENDNELSTATVDLPLEEIIVKVEYDNTNEKFILTLKNGETLEIPASSILKGVVTQTAEQELTNKTIDVDNNTLKNVEVDNFKDGVVRTSVTKIRDYDTAEDDKIATEKAIALQTQYMAKVITADNPALTPAEGQVTWTVDTSKIERNDVVVSVKEIATGEEIYTAVKQGTGTVTIMMNASAAVATGTYRATIVG